jgi:hypothetical protein
MILGRPRKYQNQEQRRRARKERAWERRQQAKAWSAHDGLKGMIGRYEAAKSRRNRHPTGLSNQQKRELALELIRAGGEIAEKFWADRPPGWDPEEAGKQLALWLKKLPGEYWDRRLGARRPELDALSAFLDSERERERSEAGVQVDLQIP